MPKRITREQILGESAVQLIGRRFLELGLLWHPTNAPLDAGIDGLIEVRDQQTGEATNAWIAVQSKGRTKLEKETATTFVFTCTPRDLDYWRRGNMPVLLVVSCPDRDEAWWISVKDYFRDDPTRQHSRRIVFDKKANALTASAPGQFLELVQAAGAGTYFRPVPKHETLYTNLLRVTRLPRLIYRAKTAFGKPALLRDELRKQVEYPPREWVLDSKHVYSVHNLQTQPWVAACEAKTVDTFATSEWALSSDPDKRRLFVRLLNECLRSMVGRRGMRFSKEDDALYFKKTPDLSRRTIRYKSRHHVAERDVFREYRSETDPSKIFYYRHVGFEPRFRSFDDCWCLEVNPTYLFTTDGINKHPRHEDYLSKIKSIEGSGAVGGSVIMFASLLRDGDDLFSDNYAHLGFGKLLEGDLEVGIDDKLWSKDDGKRRASQPVDDVVEFAESQNSESLPLWEILNEASEN